MFVAAVILNGVGCKIKAVDTDTELNCWNIEETLPPLTATWKPFFLFSLVACSWLQGELQYDRERGGDCLQCCVFHLGCQRGSQGNKRSRRGTLRFGCFIVILGILSKMLCLCSQLFINELLLLPSFKANRSQIRRSCFFSQLFILCDRRSMSCHVSGSTHSLDLWRRGL